MQVICPMHRSGTAKSIDRQSQEKAFAGIPLTVRRDERKWNGTGDERSAITHHFSIAGHDGGWQAEEPKGPPALWVRW